jgi:hypothetical protein
MQLAEHPLRTRCGAVRYGPHGNTSRSQSCTWDFFVDSRMLPAIDSGVLSLLGASRVMQTMILLTGHDLVTIAIETTCADAVSWLGTV